MIIEVTQQDIDNGVQCSSVRCPIALAAQRQIGCRWVSVGPNHLDTGHKRVPLPANARAFEYAFDLGDPVQPFSFEIALDKE
jgi:hypothetical protein